MAKENLIAGCPTSQAWPTKPRPDPARDQSTGQTAAELVSTPEPSPATAQPRGLSCEGPKTDTGATLRGVHSVRAHHNQRLPLTFLNVGEVCTQSCLTLCNPMDCSPPGSSVHGILQVRILEWIAMLFLRGSSQPRDQTQNFHTADGFFTI